MINISIMWICDKNIVTKIVYRMYLPNIVLMKMSLIKKTSIHILWVTMKIYKMMNLDSVLPGNCNVHVKSAICQICLFCPVS